jgi:putative oxidoreductase
MTNIAATHPSSRLRNCAGWGLQGLLAAAFLAAGGAKLAGAEYMVQLFDQIGLGQGLRLVTGLVEVAGGITILIPGLAAPAALWLGFTMICAVVTHLTILHTNPTPAMVLLILNGLVVWLRRNQITTLINRLR